MSSDHGRKYPGSGGATDRPRSGGAGWYPLPEDTFYEVGITETVVEKHRPGFLGRLVGRPTTYSETEVEVGREVRKKYH